MNTTLTPDVAKILDSAEAAIDATGELTRARYGSPYIDEAELVVRRTEVVVQCPVRSLRSRGFGARQMVVIHGRGPTPEAALANLIECLPYWVGALK